MDKWKKFHVSAGSKGRGMGHNVQNVYLLSLCFCTSSYIDVMKSISLSFLQDQMLN